MHRNIWFISSVQVSTHYNESHKSLPHSLSRQDNAMQSLH